MSENGPLENGGQVVILGGGPSGTSCALMLRRLAADMGKQIDITILEGKQFSGELHHNQCVGVLSPPLPRLMKEELAVPFPYHLGRTEITGYILHAGQEKIILDDTESSFAVRRVHFDAHMLETVRKLGINVVSARAVDLEIFDSSAIVYTENAPLQANVVVGAFGLDEGSASMFERVTPYHRPEALSSVVTKYHPGEKIMKSFGTRIHAFLPARSGIEFAGITPKGNHLTLNIAGKSVDTRLMRSFLSRLDVCQILGGSFQNDQNELGDWRLFRGRFPYSLAREFYGDRYVVLGDAAGLVRPFKGKGVTSAVLSGIRAARTIMQRGVSKRAFEGHFRPANQDIIGDLGYGRFARLLTIFAERYGLLEGVLRAAANDLGLRSALFGAVSGRSPYRQVLGEALAPLAIYRILFAVSRLSWNRQRRNARQPG